MNDIPTKVGLFKTIFLKNIYYIVIELGLQIYIIIMRYIFFDYSTIGTTKLNISGIA